MKARDYKIFFNTLSELDLDSEVVYNSEELSISGITSKLNKSIEDLYNIGDKASAKLYTKKELLDIGYSNEEINNFNIAIKQGSIIIQL